MLWIGEDLDINFLCLTFPSFTTALSSPFNLSSHFYPLISFCLCYTIPHPSPFLQRSVVYTSELPFCVCVQTLLATEIPTAGLMCCLLAIPSTDNIFTAFSIYKVRVKESCNGSTGGQGEICTYPTDVNKHTDREQRSATLWPPPCC